PACTHPPLAAAADHRSAARQLQRDPDPGAPCPASRQAQGAAELAAADGGAGGDLPRSAAGRICPRLPGSGADPEIGDLRVDLLHAHGLSRLPRDHGRDHPDSDADPRVQGSLYPENHFGFEAAAWYWHFVDVVWVALFIFVYVLWPIALVSAARGRPTAAAL